VLDLGLLPQSSDWQYHSVPESDRADELPIFGVTGGTVAPKVPFESFGLALDRVSYRLGQPFIFFDLQRNGQVGRSVVSAANPQIVLERIE
jgi:hypothetical protein